MAIDQASQFLRWAGSKRQLLPVLSKYWHGDCTRYVEPFAGSACLFFRLQPASAILGDINTELVATYSEVKRDVFAVMEHLASLRPGKEQYLILREGDPATLGPTARAARFIYLNRFCFNGLYRTNRAGRFNVPYGGGKSGSLPSADALMRCSRLLQSAELVCGDFENVLVKVVPGDFVYMDPPFSTRSRRVFNEYDASVFGDDDILRLRRWMEALAERDIPFLVSYAECEEADILRRGFHTEMVRVRRSIAGFAASRGDSREVLITNCGTGQRRAAVSTSGPARTNVNRRPMATEAAAGHVARD